MKKQTILSIFLLGFLLNTYAQKIDLPQKKFDQLYPSKEVVTRYHNSWTVRHYRDRIKVFKQDPLEFGEIVFVGNSITEQGRNWSEKFGIAHIRNRGIGGDIAIGILERLNEITYSKPKAVFVLIGINDLHSVHHKLETHPSIKYDKTIPNPEFVAKKILKVAKKIHKKTPDTKIYVRTIMPTRKDFLKEDILEVNSILETHAEDGLYKLIDFYTPFVDEQGLLKKEWTRDGLHLNDLGYKKWVEIEQPIIDELAK